MLEELITDCLKVYSLTPPLPPPLSLTLMSSSSEVQLDLLSQFMVGLSKVQSGCLDKLLENQKRREGPDDLCVLHFGTKFWTLIQFIEVFFPNSGNRLF